MVYDWVTLRIPFLDDVPTTTIIFRGFSIATFDYQRVYALEKTAGVTTPRQKKQLLKWTQGPQEKPSTVRAVAMPHVLMCGKKP